MSFTEWLSKPDPSEINIKEFLQSTLRYAPPARLAIPAAIVQSNELAAAIKDGAANPPHGADQIAGATKTAGAHIALRTSYNRDEAEQLARKYLEGLSADEKDKLDQDEVASRVAGEISSELGVPGVNVSADLSTPAMLNAPARIVFAGGLWLALVITIGVLAVVGIRDTASAGLFVALSVVGFSLIVAVLVLVMGYGTVRMGASVGKDAETKS